MTDWLLDPSDLPAALLVDGANGEILRLPLVPLSSVVPKAISAHLCPIDGRRSAVDDAPVDAPLLSTATSPNLPLRWAAALLAASVASPMSEAELPDRCPNDRDGGATTKSSTSNDDDAFFCRPRPCCL